MWARPSPYPTQDIERPALPSLSPVFDRMAENVTSAGRPVRQDRSHDSCPAIFIASGQQPLAGRAREIELHDHVVVVQSPPPSTSSRP
jgi:hypothetical protein